MQLILFRGLPGAGKTTLARALCQTVLSADDYFYHPSPTGWQYRFDPSSIKDAHRQCISNTEKALQLKIPLVGVANTFTQEWEIEPYRILAGRFCYRFSTVVVENRHGSPSLHGVPGDAIKAMKDRFQFAL